MIQPIPAKKIVEETIEWIGKCWMRPKRVRLWWTCSNNISNIPSLIAHTWMWCLSRNFKESHVAWRHGFMNWMTYISELVMLLTHLNLMVLLILIKNQSKVCRCNLCNWLRIARWFFRKNLISSCIDDYNDVGTLN